MVIGLSSFTLSAQPQHERIDTVCFDHVGVTDKPIPSFCLVTNGSNPAAQRSAPLFWLNTDQWSHVLKWINVNRHKVAQHTAEFGTFMVTSYKIDGTDFHVFLGKEYVVGVISDIQLNGENQSEDDFAVFSKGLILRLGSNP